MRNNIGNIIVILVLICGVGLCLAQKEEGQGIIREYYLNDKLKAEFSYKQDKLDGVSKEYYESGALASERYYKDGKRDGPAYVYTEKGILQIETIYKAGRFIDSREFDEQGKPRVGIYKEYYPSGAVWTEANYKEGRLEGEARVYYENGRVNSEFTYQKGKLQQEKTFDQSGSLTHQKNY
ncbi:MAG: toxin-antitoxin system YwqK family antitoxin [Candidatus Omnitrophica bacterium]|nr:toxin-antitoxin system YwqK family antitoxin [Candidatus Omnitrophota bacterium]